MAEKWACAVYVDEDACVMVSLCISRLHLQQQIGSSEPVCGDRAGVSSRGGLSKR